MHYSNNPGLGCLNPDLTTPVTSIRFWVMFRSGGYVFSPQKNNETTLSRYCHFLFILNLEIRALDINLRGGTPYNGQYVEASPEKGTCFTLQVNERLGISRVQVYETKMRFVIYTYFMTARYTSGAPTICQWKVYLRGTFSAKNGIEKLRGRTSWRNLSALTFLVPPGTSTFLKTCSW